AGQDDEGDGPSVGPVLVTQRPVGIVEGVLVVEGARAGSADLERRPVGIRRSGDVPGQLERAAVRDLEEVAGPGAVLGKQWSVRPRRAGGRQTGGGEGRV